MNDSLSPLPFPEYLEKKLFNIYVPPGIQIPDHFFSAIAPYLPSGTRIVVKEEGETVGVNEVGFELEPLVKMNIHLSLERLLGNHIPEARFEVPGLDSLPVEVELSTGGDGVDLTVSHNPDGHLPTTPLGWAKLGGVFAAVAGALYLASHYLW